MREQQAQITEIIVGPTELFVEALLGPRQHDSHCHGWLWNRYLEDAKLRAAAVREEGLRIIARRNERILAAVLPSYDEALQNAEMARVLFDASKGGNVRGITENHRFALANVFANRQAAE